MIAIRGIVLRFCQLGDFVIVGTIHDISTLAAALALLALRKPSGKVGNDFATLGTFQFVFVNI